MVNNCKLVNQRVKATKQTHLNFYQVALCINMENLKNIINSPVFPGDTSSLKNIYYLEEQTLRVININLEANYGLRNWVVLMALSHQLWIGNKSSKQVPYLKAHFEYCCRQLMLKCKNCKQRNDLLDSIYTITTNDHQTIHALKLNNPALDINRWRSLKIVN